jgi:hypothetical protein
MGLLATLLAAAAPMIVNSNALPLATMLDIVDEMGPDCCLPCHVASFGHNSCQDGISSCFACGDYPCNCCEHQTSPCSSCVEADMLAEYFDPS